MLTKKLFNAATQLVDYRASVWRIVETQESAATLGLVDTMDEQRLLENLLDDVKPAYRPGTDAMHYLLKTSFRYPPLKYGSRFGTRNMPSYFYASEELETALTESAYYRFIFLDDMQEPYTQAINSQHLLFSVEVRSQYCLDLCAEHFADIQTDMLDASSYACSQAVGNWALQRGDVEMIRFQSARCEQGINVALTNPACLYSKRPRKAQEWLCQSHNEKISFNSRESDNWYVFERERFMHVGVLLRPA